MSLVRIRLLTSGALACLIAWAGAAPAAASEVLRVDGRDVDVVFDPYLPSRAATDLPPPPQPATPDAGSLPIRDAQAGASVYAVIEAAVAAGRITPSGADAFRSIYDEGRQLRRHLPQARRAQLSSVVVNLERMAGAGLLTPDRMPAVFLQLERNVEFWRARGVPRAGTRVTFSGSPVIFQFYPGEGLALQPLANFGKANALYASCTDPNPKLPPCRRDQLKLLLDWMSALPAPRGSQGAVAWEYYFRFGGGRPPWTSGLSQGTGVQAMARGSRLLGDAAYLESARAGLGVFEAKPPVGVRVPSAGGAHYLLYSFNSRLRVLNGFLQAVTGLFDVARISGDPRARALFSAGDRAARRELPRYDTRQWSLYSLGGSRSDVGYHKLVRDFLRNLCERTRARVYCTTARRFTRQLRSPRTVRRFAGPRRTRGRPPGQLRAALPGPARVGLRIEEGRRILEFTKVAP